MDWMRLLLLVAGLVICFRGYSTFRVALALTACLVVAHAAYGFLRFYLPPRPEWLLPVAAASAGLLAAVLVLAAWRVGVTVLGMVLMVSATLQLTALVPTEPATRAAVLVAAALAGGLMARFLERVALTLATAAYGGLMVTSAVLRVSAEGAGGQAVGELSRGRLTAFTLVWIVLFFGGFLVQMTSRRPEREG